jgi:hypothetical protein
VVLKACAIVVDSHTLGQVGYWLGRMCGVEDAAKGAMTTTNMATGRVGGRGSREASGVVPRRKAAEVPAGGGRAAAATGGAKEAPTPAACPAVSARAVWAATKAVARTSAARAADAGAAAPADGAKGPSTPVVCPTAATGDVTRIAETSATRGGAPTIRARARTAWASVRRPARAAEEVSGRAS